VISLTWKPLQEAVLGKPGGHSQMPKKLNPRMHIQDSPDLRTSYRGLLHYVWRNGSPSPPKRVLIGRHLVMRARCRGAQRQRGLGPGGPRKEQVQ